MKKLALICSVLFFSFFAFAQITPKKPLPSEYSWRILQEAQLYYDKNDLSSAMSFALKAKENRKAESDWESYILENALSPYSVKRAGDEFEKVIQILGEREQNEAIGIVNRYLDLYSAGRFHNSFSEMKDFIVQKSVYPEADYLIGKIYQAEGEYKSAYDFYEKARKNAIFLDIPNQKFTILYSMADLANLNGDSESYEQALLLILSEDTNFDDKVLKNAVIRIVDLNKRNDIDRFFSLFRAESPFTMKALYEISKIYESQGNYKDSLFVSALGSIEGFTHIFNSLYEADQDYDFTTLAEFLTKISSYEDICRWCVDNKFYDFLIDFAEKTGNRGDVTFSKELLKILAVNIPNKYFQELAANKI